MDPEDEVEAEVAPGVAGDAAVDPEDEVEDEVEVEAAAGGADDVVLDGAPERFVPVRFVDVVVPLPSTNPVVLLEEIDPPRRMLRIPIGLPEGVAIAYAARGIDTPKPLTHELTTTLLEAFGIVMEVVRITDVAGAAFSGEVVVSGPSGTQTLPCRPSDGIALALRQRLFVPVVAASRVLEVAGSAPEAVEGAPGSEADEERTGPRSSGS